MKGQREPNLRQQKFTNANIVFAPPGRHQAGSKGLYLYVSPDLQVRRWIYRYVSPVTGKTTETGLGAVADLPLADARAKADDLRQQVAKGICPINAKRAERAERVARKTFGEVADEWIATHRPSWRGASAETNAKNLLHCHGKPLSKIAESEVTPDNIQAALTKLWAKRPVQARRALGMFERVLDYAKAKGMRTGDNPASWRGMMQYRFPRRKKGECNHMKALPYQQVPEFMKALRAKQNRSTAAMALEFCILTASRSGETLGMQWKEIDWGNRVWTVPTERTKPGRKHEVPLSDRCVALLERQKQHSNGSEFVFTGYSKDQIAARCMIWLLRSMKLSVTAHGFRSTFRDYCGDQTEFAREHVEGCLAHQVGNGVELAYRRKDALEKRRAIMDAWSAYCAGYCAG